MILWWLLGALSYSLVVVWFFGNFGVVVMRI
jgi:hypothetical protein